MPFDRQRILRGAQGLGAVDRSGQALGAHEPERQHGTRRHDCQAGEDEQGHRYPLIYEIDEFRCIFCGYCQEVCPEEAIHVGTHFENSEYSRGRFVYDLERLQSQTHAVSTLWDPADPKGE